MTISITPAGGATGELFNRLGVIIAGIKDANTYLAAGDLSSGGLRSVGVRANNIDAQYASANQDLLSGGINGSGINLYSIRDSTRSTLDQWKSQLAQLASDTIIQMIDDDTYLPSRTLENALKELILQMSGSGGLYNPDNDVDASAPTVAVAAVTNYTNTGDGNVVASVKRTDARTNELVQAEVITVICGDDAGTGATEDSEPFTASGEPAAANGLAWDWDTKGSGASTSLTSVDPTLDAQSTGNLLTNSDLEDWTTNVPDNWAVIDGAGGADLLKETSTIYSGSACLEFFEDGTDNTTAIAQTFDSSSGTTTTLKPNTIYAVGFWARKSATLTAGVLQAALVNSSNTIIDDDSGTDISIQVAHGTLTTSFAFYSGVFMTPKVLPSTYKFMLSISTAIDSAGGSQSIFVDHLAMTEMTPLYTGGPLLAVFSGDTAWAKGDRKKVTVTNAYAGDFQTYFQRLFNMRALGLQLPSDSGGSETVVDTLIT